MRDPQRILVMSFTRIGDATVSTCVIEPLRRMYPSAVLTFFVGQRAEGLIAPEVDAIHVFDPRRHSGLRGKMRLIGELRALKPDLVVDLRDAAYSRLIGPTRVPIRSRARIHAAHRYLDALEGFGIPTDAARPRLTISDTERDEARAWLAGQVSTASGPTVSLHPGGDWVYKLWDVDRFADLGDALVERRDARILVFGGPGEEARSAGLCDAMQRPSLRVQGISVRQLAALIRESDLFVGNDTGPMHMADAVGTPCVALFEPTDDVRSGPFGDEHIVIRSDMDLGCNPCHPGRHPGGCGLGYCRPLQSIQSHTVLAAAETLLDRPRVR